MVIVPRLPAFAELGEGGLLIYEPGLDGLRDALLQVAATPPAELRRQGAAARRIAASADWDSVADQTIHAYGRALSGRSGRF